MPTDAISEVLMQAIETRLALIDGSASYHNTVLYVRRVNGAAPAVSRFPSIELLWISDAPDRSIGFGARDLYESRMTWQAICYDQDATNPQLAASRLAQDVRTAIEGAPNLPDVDGNGRAKDTQWTGTDVTLFEGAGGIAVAIVKFETTYLVDRTETSTYY